jgi:hypothetical protein
MTGLIEMAVTIRKPDQQVLWLFLLSIACGCVASGLYRQKPILLTTPSFLLGMLLGGIPLALLSWGIWRGYYWAKVVFILMSLYSLTIATLQVYKTELVPLHILLLILAMMFRFWAVFIIVKDLLTRRS